MDEIPIRTYKGVLLKDWYTPAQSKWVMQLVAAEFGLKIPAELNF